MVWVQRFIINFENLFRIYSATGEANLREGAGQRSRRNRVLPYYFLARRG